MKEETARTSVGVAELPPNVPSEVEVTAVLE
jgi:enamine deaminase RidA (YjgF/YER057c/UK114 family)